MCGRRSRTQRAQLHFARFGRCRRPFVRHEIVYKHRYFNTGTPNTRRCTPNRLLSTNDKYAGLRTYTKNTIKDKCTPKATLLPRCIFSYNANFLIVSIDTRDVVESRKSAYNRVISFVLLAPSQYDISPLRCLVLHQILHT